MKMLRHGHARLSHKIRPERRLSLKQVTSSCSRQVQGICANTQISNTACTVPSRDSHHHHLISLCSSSASRARPPLHMVCTCTSIHLLSTYLSQVICLDSTTTEINTLLPYLTLKASLVHTIFDIYCHALSTSHPRHSSFSIPADLRLLGSAFFSFSWYRGVWFYACNKSLIVVPLPFHISQNSTL